MNLVTLDAVARHIGERTLFEDVALRINGGDRIGLIGINGSGKSSLLRLIAGVDTPDAGSVTVWGGVRIQHLAQDPALADGDRVLDHLLRSGLPEVRLLREYREVVDALQSSPDDAGLQNRFDDLSAELDRTGGWSAEVKVRTVLSRLGITDVAVPVATLSGGQRKRVALARALLDPADLLLLDEPTNHLDADAIAWLEDYLLGVPGALVMVTHDRYFLDRVVNRIVEIDRRQIVSYPGNYTGYLELRAERHERLVAGERRRENLLRRELAWLRRAPKARATKQRARAQRVEELAQIEHDSGDERVAIALGGRRLGQRVLAARDLAKAYGPLDVLAGLDLDLAPGERIGVIGPNGSGKTTLLDVLSGRLAPDAGTVTWGDSVELGYFDQRSTELDDSERVLDFIESRAPLIVAADGERVSASQMLEWFLFDRRLQHGRIGSLSGGERRRLYLLWTLVQRPNVLFLDEPTNDLDVPTLTVLEEFLDHFRGCVVVASHDRYFLDRTVDEIVALEGGRFTHRHPAPYAVFQRLRDETVALAGGAAARVGEGARGTRAGAARRQPAPDGPRPPTWKERRELAELDTWITDLEARKVALARELTLAGADYVRLGALTESLAEADAELDALLPRWLELSDLVSGG